jgi:hypothetical protein
LPFSLPFSYYFTRFTHVWGWATSKNAWEKMDLRMPDWRTERETSFLSAHLSRPYAVDYWKSLFDSVVFGEPQIWDYQWTYAVWKAGGIAICPSVNLVSNIGFGAAATHTLNTASPLSSLPLGQLGNIVHPPLIEIDENADAWVRDYIYSPKPLSKFDKIIKKIRPWIPWKGIK